MALIEIKSLTKYFRVPVKSPGLAGAVRHLFSPHYREKMAVDGIDFTIERGDSVAYVGPNGAGKSTTIKMLTGILVPTRGEVRVCGLNPHQQRSENAKNIGVVFGQRTQLWWDLPVQESLRLLGDIYEVPRDTFERNLKEFTELLELGPLLTTPARQLSLGQRMRCDLAASLLHSPPILFLDEPTIGLDVAVKARIRAFIQRSNRENGTTVLLTSHDLGDIEDLCSRMLMIDKGRLVFDGPLHEIKDRFGRKRVVHLMLHEASPRILALAQETLPELPNTAFAQPDPYTLRVEFDAQSISSSVLVGKLLAALPVNDLRMEEADIESIIRHLYEGTLQFDEAT